MTLPLAVRTALAIAVAIPLAAQAQSRDGLPATVPEDVVVRVCMVGDEAALLAMREVEAGRWEMLGGLRGAQVFQQGDSFTILLDQQVMQISQRRLVVIKRGEVTEGICARAELALDALLADLRSGEQ